MKRSHEQLATALETKLAALKSKIAKKKAMSNGGLPRRLIRIVAQLRAVTKANEDVTIAEYCKTVADELDAGIARLAAQGDVQFSNDLASQ